MSLTFTITPKKRFLRFHRALSVREALALGPEGLQPFGIDDEDLEDLLRASLRDAVVHVGVPELSGRGCELSFEGGAYVVREFTPATPVDWRLALDLLAALSQHLEAPIVDEDGAIWSAETITEFDYSTDIAAGIQVMTRHPGDGTMLHGIIRPVSLTVAMIEDIRTAISPIERFGEIFTEIQDEPGYDARLQLSEAPDGSVLGLYALSEGVRTVLPRTPYIDPTIYPELRSEDVTWKLVLVVDGESEEPELAGEIGYAEALARLDASSVHALDDASLVVHELSGDAIRALEG